MIAILVARFHLYAITAKKPSKKKPIAQWHADSASGTASGQAGARKRESGAITMELNYTVIDDAACQKIKS